MGPGMFDDLWKGLVSLAVLLFVAGWACSAGCRYVNDRYEIRIERSAMGGR